MQHILTHMHTIHSYHILIHNAHTHMQIYNSHHIHSHHTHTYIHITYSHTHTFTPHTYIHTTHIYIHTTHIHSHHTHTFTNSEQWFTTSFLQPLPQSIIPQVSQIWHLMDILLLVLKRQYVCKRQLILDISFITTLLMPAQIKPKSSELRWNSFLFCFCLGLMCLIFICMPGHYVASSLISTQTLGGYWQYWWTAADHSVA